MNFSSVSLYNQYEEELRLALPKYCYRGYTTSWFNIETPCIFIGKALTIFELNTDSQEHLFESDVEQVINFDDEINWQAFIGVPLINIQIDLQEKINTEYESAESYFSDKKSLTLIDKFPILTPGVYKMNVIKDLKEHEPTKLMKSISQLLYLLALQDVSSVYSLIEAISVEANNLLAESRQITPRFDIRHNHKIKAFQL
ncbi:MAG: hypothetical protein M0Q41_10920 [Bacteroidales bacterium]|nr:hypothetical protein [Acholeplasmataceae bacterium]MCK9449474.1 hypothetical protein [Bacteroidales bacterium]